MENQVLPRNADVLAENLFSLQEPWRDRFLTLVARRAVGWSWDGPPPTRDEVRIWLRNAGLCEAVTMLLDAWPQA
jgi:hypothetical protein